MFFLGGLRYSAAAFFGQYGTFLLAMLVAQVGEQGGPATGWGGAASPFQ